jgi:tetratricopeptide (TPR) repeat protein
VKRKAAAPSSSRPPSALEPAPGPAAVARAANPWPEANTFGWIALAAIAAVTFAAHAFGAGPLRSVLWGSHFYGFLPISAVAVSALATCSVLGALRYGALLAHALPAPPQRRWPMPSVPAVLGVVGALGLFWIFRAGHLLWGDGRPLADHIAAGDRFHPREPLTFLLQHYVFVLGRPLFDSLWMGAADVARSAIALGSAVTGALFMPVAWGLARSFSASTEPARVPGPAAEIAAPAPADSGIVPLVFLVLVAQGYVQLFFGYVENYTFYTLALGLYLLGAHRFLAGRAPLAVPGVALVTAAALHLSAMAMAPSFVVLVAAGLARPERRLGVLRDLAITASAFAAAAIVLALQSPGYRFDAALWSMTSQVGRETVQIEWGYLGSMIHVRDFLNEQLLIGPLGLFLFLPAALAALSTRARRESGVLFSLATGAGYLAACWIAGDSNLGYSRNWDLLAPAGFVFTAAGLHLLLRTRWSRDDLRRWLRVAALVSLFHTVPWIAMNTSFDYSFARLKSLPLGYGRTEAIVGSWYFGMGDYDQASDWFRRSLAAYPANNVAAYYLGEIDMERGDYRAAIEYYALALRARPGKELYRARLAEALIRDGNVREAKSHLDTLIAANDHDARYWLGYGIVLDALGGRAQAHEALRHARALAAKDSLTAAIADRLEEGADARSVVQDHWPGLGGQ